MKKTLTYSFGILVTTNDLNGEVEAVYFQVRKGKVAETREFHDGAAFADYDKDGYLLGVELLQPCRVTIIDVVAANESPTARRDMKRALRQSGPRQMIAA